MPTSALSRTLTAGENPSRPSPHPETADERDAQHDPNLPEKPVDIESAVAFFESVFFKDHTGWAKLAFTAPDTPGKFDHRNVPLGAPDRTAIARKFIAQFLPTHNCYVSIAVFAKDSQWNPNKVGKNGKRGGYSVRTRAMVLHGRWAIAERDDHALGPGVPRPTFIVTTSTGRFQDWYELATPVPEATLRELNVRLARASGFGNEAIDSTRVLRLPGSRNYKPERRGEIVRIVSATDALYSPDDLRGLAPLTADDAAPPPTSAVATQTPSTDTNLSATSTPAKKSRGRTKGTPPRAKQTRALIKASRCSDTSTCLIVPAEGITREWLVSLDTNEEFVRAAARYMILPEGVGLGEAFLCPFHSDANPSVSFQCNADGFWYFHEWHLSEFAADGETRNGLRTLTLAEVYAALMSGVVAKLPKPTHAVWKLRLLCDMGWLQPVPIAFPPLPASATESQRQVYNEITFLFRVRWLWDDGAKAPLTWQWTARWCGLSENTTHDGIEFLLEHGILRRTGKEHGLNVFLPGVVLAKESGTPTDETRGTTSPPPGKPIQSHARKVAEEMRALIRRVNEMGKIAVDSDE